MGANTFRRPWVRKKLTVPSGDTTVVDSIKSALFLSAYYRIRARNLTDDTLKTMALSAEKAGAGTIEQVFNRSGGAVSMNVSTDIQTGNFVLVIENTGPDDIEIVTLRSKV